MPQTHLIHVTLVQLDLAPKEQDVHMETPVSPPVNVVQNGDGLDEETIRKNREKMFSMINTKKKTNRYFYSKITLLIQVCQFLTSPLNIPRSSIYR